MGSRDSRDSGLLCADGNQGAALGEFTKVFEMIAEEYREKGKSLPTDTTEIVNAWRHCARLSARVP